MAKLSEKSEPVVTLRREEYQRLLTAVAEPVVTLRREEYQRLLTAVDERRVSRPVNSRHEQHVITTHARLPALSYVERVNP